MKSKIHHQPNGGNNGVVVTGNDNGCRSESPSPPLSPNRRLLRRQRRQTLLRASSFSLRRNLRYLLLLPMIYASGLLMCVGPFSGLVGWIYVPGSVYRSSEIYRILKDDMFSDNSTALEVFVLLQHVYSKVSIFKLIALKLLDFDCSYLLCGNSKEDQKCQNLVLIQQFHHILVLIEVRS